MNRLQYRRFSDGHESLVANHTVNVSTTGGNQAGIRWYEIRGMSGTATIFQQGTYAPDADNRWMGSIAMDQAGDIALGYSVSSSNVSPSIRYTGRLAGDPLGTLPQGEATLIAGSGSQTSSFNRWGDYSMMAVDPTDDCTFWYTQEYYAVTSTASWQTRVGSFKFPNCAPPLTITSVQASNINAISAVVTWQTSNSASSRVDYGTTAAYGSSVSDPSNVTNHSLTLNGLSNDTTYHFKATSTDTFSQSGSSSDATFVTHTNLLSNGGFEAGAAGWSLAPQAVIDTNPADAHSGNNSVLLTATGPWQATSSATLAITGGKAYSFNGWGRASSGTGYFSLFSYDATGNQIASNYLPFAGAGSWVNVIATYTAPPNAVAFRLALQNANSGTFGFDDITLTLTDNLIPNGGFESGSAGWSLAPQAVIDTNPADAHSGNNSLLLTATGPWQATSSATLAITGGKAYSFNGWGRASSGTGYFSLFSYDATGNQIASNYLPFAGAGSWVNVIATYTAPPNAVAFRLALQNANSGTFGFDDITLTP
jgi:hypothetical protein